MENSEKSPAEMSHLNPKWILKNLLRRFGYDLVRFDEQSVRPLQILDMAVECVHRRTDDFFFLQIGANDGVRHDPIRHLIYEHQLRGLLVEPLPDIYDALVKNYADAPQLIFENVAIAPEGGELKIYRFSSDAPVHDDLHGLASTDKTRMEKFAQKSGLSAHLEEVTVPCLGVAELFNKHKIDHVDLLQIDVEGFEYQIFRAILEAGILPTIVNLEFLHLSPADRIATQRLLVTHSYSYSYTGIDLLAMQPADAWQKR